LKNDHCAQGLKIMAAKKEKSNTQSAFETSDELSTEQTENNAQSSDAFDQEEVADELASSMKMESSSDLQRQLREAEDRSMRAQAELDNFRKRTRREMDDRERFAVLPLISDLLPVVDHLDLALQAASTEQDAAQEDSSGLIEGVRIVRQQLADVLQKYNCQPIQSTGQPFDPNRHEAVQMQPNDEIPANHVSLEVRSGYMLHDRVIRPSQVFVSTGPASES
jgi:molecular chaperone GrpE